MQYPTTDGRFALGRALKTLTIVVGLELAVGVGFLFYPNGFNLSMYIGPLSGGSFGYLAGRWMGFLTPFFLGAAVCRMRVSVRDLGQNGAQALEEELTQLDRMRRDAIITLRFFVFLFFPLLLLWCYLSRDWMDAAQGFAMALVFYLAYGTAQRPLGKTIQRIQAGEIELEAAPAPPIPTLLVADVSQRITLLQNQAASLRKMTRAIYTVAIMSGVVEDIGVRWGLNFIAVGIVFRRAKEIEQAVLEIDPGNLASLPEQLYKLCKRHQKIMDDFHWRMVTLLGFWIVAIPLGMYTAITGILSDVILIAVFAGFELQQRRFRQQLEALVHKS